MYMKTLSLITFALLLNSCGENTTTPISTDIANISIDTLPVVYSTEQLTPKATVYLLDGTTADATQSVDWKRDNPSMLSLSNELTILPLVNDGNSTLTAGYKGFQYYVNSVNVDIVGLDSNTSWNIVSPDTNLSTGSTYTLSAEGNFTNGTKNKQILRNITWSTSNTSIATISVDTNYIYTMTTHSAGDVNITATLQFTDINASMTTLYTVY